MNLRKIVGTRPLVIVGSSVIVINQDKQILLQLRTDNSSWGLAGGSLEPGETLEEVATRELYEETGLIANRLTYFKTFSGEDFYYKYPHGDEVYNVISVYICSEFNGELKGDQVEVQDLQYFALHDLPDNISPPDKKVIESFIELCESVSGE